MEPKTLFVASMVVIGVLAVLAAMVSQKRGDSALTTWAAGLIGSLLGFALLVVGGTSPSPYLLVLGNLFAFAYNFSLPVGLRSFVGNPRPWPLHSTVLLAVWAVGLFLFTVPFPSYPLRESLNSICTAILALEFLFVLFFRKVPGPRSLKTVIAATVTGYALFHAYRALAVYGSSSTGVLDDAVLASMTFLVFLAVSVLWSGGLLMLDSYRLRQKLESDAVELHRLNLLKDRILAMTGHDLRGPVGNLRMIWGELGSAIQSGNGAAIDPELLVLVDRSLAGTQDLLENLFSFAEAQQGASDPEQRALLSLAVSGSCDLWLSAARSKGVELLNQGGDSPLVRANQETVSAVLRNLIGNAVKFTPAGGTVTVKVISDAERGPCVEVTDTGIGMDTALLERVDALAEKVSRPGTDGERGSGFGLVLVKELVDGWGGTVKFDSAPGRGTKVRVSFVV